MRSPHAPWCVVPGSVGKYERGLVDGSSEEAVFLIAATLTKR